MPDGPPRDDPKPTRPPPPIAYPVGAAYSSPRAAAADERSIHRDLYCLQCGYNLRGLTGDPRRCPECGHMNPLGDIEVPAELIKRQLHRLETAPTICIAGLLLGIGFGIPAVMVAVSLPANPSPAGLQPLCCLSAPVVISIPMWLGGMDSFRRNCRSKRGWGAALVRYHVYGLLVTLPVIAIPFAIMLLAEPSYSGWLGRWAPRYDEPPCFLLVGLLLLLVVYVLVAGRWACRKAKGDMKTLQRETAVSLARQRLQLLLTSPGRRPFRP